MRRIFLLNKTLAGLKRNRANVFGTALLLLACVTAYICSRRQPHYDRPLRIGIDHAPPFQMIRADGGVEGLSVDMLGEAAKRRGIPITFVPIRGLLPDEALRADLVDIWPALGITKERQRWLHNTEPWLSNRYALISLASAHPSLPRTVATKRIAILAPVLARKYPNIRFLPKADRPDALQAVCNGNADAAFVETRYLDQALLDRPPGCESARFRVQIVNDVSLDLAIFAKPGVGRAADILRSEIGRLANEGKMAASLDRWSPFSASETQSVYALKEAERSRKLLAEEAWTGLGIMALFLWQLRRIRRTRKAELRLASELRAEQERWQLVLAANNDGLFDWDIRTGERFVSSRWKEALGIAADAVIDSDGEWRTRIHPEDSVRVQTALEDYLADRSNSYLAEYRMRHCDSSWRWVLAKAYCVRDKSGQAVRLVGSVTDITDRKAAEQKLRDSELRYRDLFEHSPLPTWIYDVDTLHIVDANQLACTQYQYSREELIGMHLTSLTPEEEWEQVRALPKVEQAGRRAGKWRQVRKDGSILLTEIVSHAVDTPGHRRTRLVVATDITEREAAHERFQVLFEHSSDAHLLFDQSGLIDCNAAAIRMLTANGKEQLIGLHPAHFSPERQPDGRLSAEKCVEMDRLAFENGSHRFDWNHKRLDGSEFPCEVSLTRVWLSGRESMLVVWHDLTKRKKTEEKMRLLSSVARESTSGIVITDAQERILYVNPAFEKMTGFSLNELEGRRPATMLQGSETSAEGKALLRGAVQSRNAATVELINYQKGGNPYWTEMHITPVFDGLGECTHFVAVQNDVTGRRKSEEALRAAMHAAEAGARAKSEFLAVMSHEIRTPMNGVIGMTSLLLDTPLSVEQREQVETIRVSGNALLTVINDVLDFSKIEAGRMDLEHIEFNLRDTVEEALEMIADAAHRKNLELNTTIDGDVPEWVWGDPGRVRQVLVNYLANAVKFTDSGEVQVRVMRQEGEGGSLIRCAVTDTGIGLTREQQGRLFAAFSQADSSTTRRFGGTGLGLAICRTLACLMGGTVGVASEEGHGSTFWFTIRLEPGGHLHSQSARPLLAGRRALLIDGNDIARRNMAARLLPTGLSVVEAATEEEARMAIQCEASGGGRFDVALFGLRLDDANEFLAVSRLRNQQVSQLPFLIMTVSHGGNMWEHAMRLGSISVLTKPVRQSRLMSALAALLAESIGEPLPAIQKVAAQSCKGNVLLAEDNPVNQKVARMMLTRLGCAVHCVSNGRDAVEAFKSRNYDLILMDCQMPEMDGYDATRQIRSHEISSGGRIPIIALTANTLNGESELCHAAGMDFYLSKPIRIETLAKAIERWLERSDNDLSTVIEVDAEQQSDPLFCVSR